MQADTAIEVEGLSKFYFLAGRRPRSAPLGRLLTLGGQRPQDDTNELEKEVAQGHAFWALKDLSFSVRCGEVLGIIGRNGAGKSTLLKILSRITAPTHGRAQLRGRVVSLLEVGTGFHDELTGRENLYLNGSILGMTADEIARKLDAIVEFSGVSRFLDTPVKYYSSGMRVRLGFSIAAHVEPEILIIDEVLAVGDAAFQEKCLSRVNSLAEDSLRTVIFVSHSMAAVGSLCSRTMLIDAGKVVADGDTGAVIARYHSVSAGEHGTVELQNRRDRTGSGLLRMTKVELEDPSGKKIPYARCGDPVRLSIEYEASAKLLGARNIVANIVVSNSKGSRLFGVPSDVVRQTSGEIAQRGRFVCSLEEIPVIPGHYTLDVAVLIDRELADKVMGAGAITVVEGDYFGSKHLPIAHYGDMLVRYKWDFLKLASAEV